MVEVEEVPKESTGREAESPSEVIEKHNPLTGLGLGNQLVAGNAPFNSGRHLAGADKGFDGDPGGLGAFPAAS